jgi:hypothetical protein
VQECEKIVVEEVAFGKAILYAMEPHLILINFVKQNKRANNEFI